jgi:LAO/AO transport system ATPase
LHDVTSTDLSKLKRTRCFMPLSPQHSLIKELEGIQAAMEAPLDEETQSLLTKAYALEKWPIAQLISIFERNNTDSLIKRHAVCKYLDANAKTFDRHASVIGLTGTPGAGKSSLTGELCLSFLEQQPEMSIAVLAIDPSSQESGGALLGDRTRMQLPVNDKRIFFRSQASHLDLGGMGKSTFHVMRLLRRLFDLVIIETVGIGQSEIEVQRLSDHTVLVMQPLAGDQVQFMKAGIMEVPDTFVINKCDEDELAKKSKHLLSASLKLAKIHVRNEESPEQSIFMTSATKCKGIQELMQHLLAVCEQTQDDQVSKQEHYFLNKWIQQAYGEFGLSLADYFNKNGKSTGTFEQKELKFKSQIANFLTKLS